MYVRDRLQFKLIYFRISLIVIFFRERWKCFINIVRQNVGLQQNKTMHTTSDTSPAFTGQPLIVTLSDCYMTNKFHPDDRY